MYSMCLIRIIISLLLTYLTVQVLHDSAASVLHLTLLISHS